MREYIVHYDCAGQYWKDGKLYPCEDMTVTVSAQNKKEARKVFNEIYYGLWHTDWNHRAMHIKIERKETN